MADVRGQLQQALGDAYRITDELAGGGMSRVFIAEDRELERKVVVKVLPPDLAAGLNVDRFRREIQLAARLQHPHIVPLLSAGARDGLLFYTMPLIGGETLRARLNRAGELPIGEAVRIVRDIADALEYAHGEGVAHRDIKPDNVLVSGHHALVTDFGVSKALSSSTGAQSITSIGVALGTPAYMSPEQATADPTIDHRTDIYALGVLFYELLAGRPPFTGLSSQQILAAQVTEPPVPITKHRPNISRPMAELIMRCLEKKPADRWQTAAEIRTQLEQLATPSGGLPPADRQGLVGSLRSSRRDLVIVASAVLAGVGLVAAIAVAALKSRPVEAPFSVGTTRQLTNDPGLEITPAISPDGKFVAYAAGNAARTRIYVRQWVGGRPILVADDAPGSQRSPRWSPNGSEIAFTTGDGIYIAPAFGGNARRIMDTTGLAGRAFQLLPLSDVAWAPDGRRLAVADGARIYVFNTDGSGRRTLTS
ncbi:MAG: protein kinase, partial [Gemmatimonadaceae bacterium]